MTTAGNDTGGTREDAHVARRYQQIIGAQATRYAATYDADAGLARFKDWLQKHVSAELDLDADQAVAQLYGTHYPALVRLSALLVRDTPTAEQVVQDSFAAMRDGWHRLGDAEKALAYLRQAVVNRSRSVLRHRTVAGQDLRQAPPDLPPAEPEALAFLEQPAVAAALRELPERQREAIALRYYADLSEAEIAATMRISRGAVKSHTARGMSALRAALEQATSQPVRPPDSGETDCPKSP
jgi:RNA polymerase sigma-70 factor (sigma-E family)